MINITDFADRLGIPLSPGVSETELDAFETAVGFPLPDEARTLYRTCNGLAAPDHRFRLIPLDEIRSAWIPGLRRLEIPEFWRYLPFIDREDSNPLCFCCASVMCGYIVQVFHDDVAQVKYRALESCFAALLNGAAADMDRPFRIEQEIAIGHQLLAQAETLSGETREDAIRFGIWLLSEAQMDEIIPLLEFPDRQVVYDVEDRLKVMSDPRAQQALERHNRSKRPS